jgi:hypothetical protein
VHGTIAAQVFALFRESVELPEIVMRTQQSPATIRALYEEYRRPLEASGNAPPDLSDYDRSSRELDARIVALQAGRHIAASLNSTLPAKQNGGNRAGGQ